MPSTDTWFQEAFVAFAVIYIVLAIIRIAGQWKHTKALVELKMSQDRGLEERLAKSRDTVTRGEEALSGMRETTKAASEHVERWSSILTRLEALLDKLERRSGT
jgi:hypothetical protein